MCIFDQIKQLYQDKLFSNVVQLLQILTPAAIIAKGQITTEQEFLLYFYYADSLCQCNFFAQAENVYSKTLELLKSITKIKKRSPSLNKIESISENDIKYRLYKCAKYQNDQTKALLILENIPQRQRSVSMNMDLGCIYMKTRQDNNAIICLKEVLKSNPLCLEAITFLIKLNVKSNEIINLVSPVHPNMEWLPTWIRACSHLYTADVSQSLPLFQQLLDKPCFVDNPEIISSYGEALYYNGDYKKAILLFRRAYKLNPLMTRHMDCYASCLVKENMLKELEKIANSVLPRCESKEFAPELWIILGYYCFLVNKKESKSIYLAQKACIQSNNSTEAILLKAMIMSESKNHNEVINYLSEAYNAAPYRFEIIQALTDAYISDNRRSQAISIANQAFKNLGQTPRTLTLFAQVMLSETEKANNKKTAKTSLEKAIKIDCSYLPAVYLLVNIYMEEKNIDKSIEILNKALDYENNDKLHRLLGDCYLEKNEHDKAVHHHNIATKLEVNYRNTNEVSQRLEKATPKVEHNDSTAGYEQEHEETHDSDSLSSDIDNNWA